MRRVLPLLSALTLALLLITFSPDGGESPLMMVPIWKIWWWWCWTVLIGECLIMITLKQSHHLHDQQIYFEWRNKWERLQNSFAICLLFNKVFPVQIFDFFKVATLRNHIMQTQIKTQKQFCNLSLRKCTPTCRQLRILAILQFLVFSLHFCTSRIQQILRYVDQCLHVALN